MINSCPLENIYDTGVYHFVDETEIVYLTNKNLIDGVKLNNCTWHFATPYDYKFKISISNMDQDNMSLHIFNDKGENFVINGSYMKRGFPYYIEGKNITVAYNGKSGFEGQITVVKIVLDKTQLNNCRVIKKNSTDIVWTNWSEDFSWYPNNAKCSLNLTIPWKNKIIAHIKLSETYIEQYADSLTFFFDNQVVDSLSTYFLHNTFQADKDGYNSYVLWEFESDGSISSQGFYINFSEIECKCGPSDIMIPCFKVKKYYLSGDEKNYYCGNQHCNYRIIKNPECPDNFFYLSCQTIGLPYDKFELISNNITIANIIRGNIYALLIPSTNENTLKFTSFPNVLQEEITSSFPSVLQEESPLHYYLASLNPPSIYITVILTEETFFFVLEIGLMPSNSFAIIKLNEELMAEKDELEFFTTCVCIKFLVFYAEENFTTLIKTTFGHNNYNLYYLNSKNGKFIIYKNNELANDEVIFFRALKKHTRNCIFKQNVFSICDMQSNGISALAKNYGDCNVALLNCSGYNDFSIYKNFLSHFYTTSKINTTKLIAMDKPILEFRKENSNIWKNISLSSPFYSVIIPANSSALFRFNYKKMGAIEKISLIAPYKTLWTPTFYRHFNNGKAYYYHSELMIIVGDDQNVKFTVLECDLSINATLTISTPITEVKEKVQNVTFSGEIFTFTNTSVTIKFYEGVNAKSNVKIEMEAEEN